MILADIDIERLCTSTHVSPYMIAPYDSAALQPASYDCTLGSGFQVFNTHNTPAIDPAGPEPRCMPEMRHVDVASHFVLHPNEFALGTTEEFFIIPDDITARIEGKSSLGRLGLLTHVTAGFIDPGFEGTVTLEFKNLLQVPILLRPGMAICQMSFIKLTQKARAPYSGRYQGDRGAVASRYGSS